MKDPNVIHGRPDFGNPKFGVTRAKKFPPYVFSVSGNASLIHKVLYVELHWWKGHNDRMIKLHRPKMIATTVCGMSKFLEGKRARTCILPKPDAILCGRCHGEVASFGKHGKATKAGISRQAAHIKLGCVVNGYNSPLGDDQ